MFKYALTFGLFVGFLGAASMGCDANALFASFGTVLLSTLFAMGSIILSFQRTKKINK